MTTSSKVPRTICGVALAATVFTSFVILAGYAAQGRDPLMAKAGSRASAEVVIQDEVVVSAHGMREDTPLYLSSRPEPLCISHGCKLPDSNIPDRTALVATCFVLAAEMTNINLRDVAARTNPNGVTSNLWYLVNVGSRRGFVSEVYLTPRSRGGLGLRRCETMDVTDG